MEWDEFAELVIEASMEEVDTRYKQTGLFNTNGVVYPFGLFSFEDDD